MEAWKDALGNDPAVVCRGSVLREIPKGPWEAMRVVCRLAWSGHGENNYSSMGAAFGVGFGKGEGSLVEKPGTSAWAGIKSVVRFVHDGMADGELLVRFGSNVLGVLGDRRQDLAPLAALRAPSGGRLGSMSLFMLEVRKVEGGVRVSALLSNRGDKEERETEDSDLERLVRKRNPSWPGYVWALQSMTNVVALEGDVFDRVGFYSPVGTVSLIVSGFRLYRVT